MKVMFFLLQTIFKIIEKLGEITQKESFLHSIQCFQICNIDILNFLVLIFYLFTHILCIFSKQVTLKQWDIR